MRNFLLAILMAAAVAIQLGCGTAPAAPNKPNAIDKAFFVPTTNSAGNLELKDNPAITQTLKTTGALPIPYASLGSSVALALLALYREKRNKSVLKSVVASVETARDTLTPEQDASFVQALALHQEASGVQPAVDKILLLQK